MRRIAALLCLVVSVCGRAHAQETAQCLPPGGPPILRPILSTHTLPPYPKSANTFEEEGVTLLRVGIGVDGAPTEVIVETSSGSVRLDSAAAAYIKAVWKWQPPLGQDCAPTTTVTRVSVNWSLKDAQPPDAIRYTQLHMALVDYPPGAQERKEQGFVTLVITLPADGSAPKFIVSYSSGFSDLDDKALDIVKTRYHWKAGEMDGKPVITTLGVLAIWTLPLPEKK